jgi:hypothetical protein
MPIRDVLNKIAGYGVTILRLTAFVSRIFYFIVNKDYTDTFFYMKKLFNPKNDFFSLPYYSFNNIFDETQKFDSYVLQEMNF